MTARRSSRAAREPEADLPVVPGRQPVREALRAGRELRFVVLDRRLGEGLADIGDAARAQGIDVRTATRDELDAMAGDVRHQGVVAVAAPFRYVPLERLATSDLVVVLDGITDPRNLGAIARVAEQAGAGGMVIRDKRAAGPSPAAEKAAAGALSWLPIARVTNITRALAELGAAGLWGVGLDGGGTSTIWDQPLLDERVALVIGEEGAGLSRLVAERVDAVAAIPMNGRLDSLNASTAAAITLYEWARRRHGR